jgi:hypothetical protein
MRQGAFSIAVVQAFRPARAMADVIKGEIDVVLRALKRAKPT